jgi:hypothetical protein
VSFEFESELAEIPPQYKDILNRVNSDLCKIILKDACDNSKLDVHFTLEDCMLSAAGISMSVVYNIVMSLSDFLPKFSQGLTSPEIVDALRTAQKLALDDLMLRLQAEAAEMRKVKAS